MTVHERASLGRVTLGRPRLHLRRTNSTNDRARELALAGAPGGTLVTASEQTCGRGRQGRRWTAPAGTGLLMSLLLRAGSPPSGTGAGDRAARPVERSLALLPLIAAVAVCDVVGDRALIKWPNDVVLARAGGLAKLAGILVEGRPQEGWAVLGIGMNVAVRLEDLPGELRASAATLGKSSADIEATLARLLEALQRRLADGQHLVLDAWRSRDALRGRDVGWAGGGGRAQGIDEDGRLLVALSGGGHIALGAGEVHLRAAG